VHVHVHCQIGPRVICLSI